MCRRGELEYLRKHPDVVNAIEAGIFKSAWEHFQNFGAKEGRVYGCCHPPCKFIETHACPLGEAAYNAEYPEVAEAIKRGIFDSAFEHFRNFGRSEGRSYICCHEPNDCRYDKGARLIAAREHPVPEGLCRMDLASSRSVLVTGEKEILPTLERCVDLQNRYCNMGTQDKGTLDEKEADHRVEEEEEHQKEEGEEDEIELDKVERKVENRLAT